MDVVFVGGSARSGTTLLHSVLCSSPDTNPAVVEDTTMQHLVLSYEDAVGNLKRDMHFIFGDQEGATRFHRGLIDLYLEQLRSAWPDARCLVIKHPRLTANFPTLAKLLPDARFVIVVRDPRAVISSLLTVSGRVLDESTPVSSPDDVMPHIARFKYHYASSLRHFLKHGSDRCKWVRYEDLVTRPLDLARALGAFTGLDLSTYDPDRPWRGWDDGMVDLEDRRSRPYFAELWGQPVATARIEAWRENLDAEQVAIIERETGSFMKFFHYRPAHSGPATSGASAPI